jgi:hypothetical protein
MARPHLSPETLAAVSGIAVVVVIAAAALGIWWAISGGGGNATSTTTPTATTAPAPAGGGHPTGLSHRQYALLYLQAVVHKTRISVLGHWPSPPYQHYSSGNQTCYEWWDKPVALYNLCFVKGVLSLKAIE